MGAYPHIHLRHLVREFIVITLFLIMCNVAVCSARCCPNEIVVPVFLIYCRFFLLYS